MYADKSREKELWVTEAVQMATSYTKGRDCKEQEKVGADRLSLQALNFAALGIRYVVCISAAVALTLSERVGCIVFFCLFLCAAHICLGERAHHAENRRSLNSTCAHVTDTMNAMADAIRISTASLAKHFGGPQLRQVTEQFSVLTTLKKQ